MLAEGWKRNSNNKNFQFWQQDNNPTELYCNALLEQKLGYIHINPVTAGLVMKPEDYLYSSARNYAGLQDILLEVEFID